MFSALSKADRQTRLIWSTLAVPLLVILAWWNPSANPGPVLCGLRLGFAVPCPLCGATRGVALCLRGELVNASMYHPLAIPITLVGLAVVAGWLAESLLGRRLLPTYPVWLTWWGLVPVFLLCWVYLLIYRREDDFSQSLLAQLLRVWWAA